MIKRQILLCTYILSILVFPLHAVDIDSTELTQPDSVPMLSIETKAKENEDYFGMLQFDGMANKEWIYRTSLEFYTTLRKTNILTTFSLASLSIMNDGDDYHLSMNSVLTGITVMFLFAKPGNDFKEGISLKNNWPLLPLAINAIPNSSLLFPIIKNHAYIRLGQNMDFYLFIADKKVYYENNIGLQCYFSNISLYAKVSKPWLKAYRPNTDPYIYVGLSFGKIPKKP